MFSTRASSSMADPSAQEPGPSQGERMKVGKVTLPRRTRWLVVMLSLA
jgi:hypothetical protein